ncbi:MAG: ABC transporter permease [Armatimonadetes bacterium]|nr:ABC transporter permease [Armatimonadota bacterium]
MAYLLRRLAATIPTLLGAITFAFLLIRVAPGDPVRLILSDIDRGNREAVEEVRRQLGLDRPLYVQYAVYLTSTLRGQFGTSFRTSQPVIVEIAGQLTGTVHLAMAAVVVAVAVGLPVGIVAALRRNTWVDYSVLSGAMVALASPSFWFGILLIYMFAFRLGWFPIFGAGRPDDLASLLHHLALPAVAIGTRSAALIARMSRSALLEVLHQDYIRTARAKGLAARAVVLRHALRNALIPITTIVALDMAYLLGGAVIIETVFARPGLGKLAVDAIYTRDYPVVQGVILVFAAGIILVNFLVDVLYGLLDPRIRYG